MILGILGFLFLICVVNLIIIFHRASKTDDVPGGAIDIEDFEPVSYQDILYSERPYIDNLYN